MLKKTNLFLFCTLVLLSSCRTLLVSDYHTSQTATEKIPGLKLLIHERSFGESFLYGMSREVVVNPVYGPAAPDLMHVSNPALHDVILALQNELQDHVSDNQGPLYGHARFKLSYYNVWNSGWGYIIPSYLTIYVANVFGMPVRVMRTEVELELEITDAANHVIGHYSAPGVGKATEALYYGYDHVSAARKANILAIQNAMGKIEQQVGTDALQIKTQLAAAGALGSGNN
jgi:hypothetical protein